MNAPFRRRLVRQGVESPGAAAERSRPTKLRILLRDKGVREKRAVGRSDYARRSRHLMDHGSKWRHARVQFICCPTKTINSRPPILLPHEVVVAPGRNGRNPMGLSRRRTRDARIIDSSARCGFLYMHRRFWLQDIRDARSGRCGLIP